MKKKLMLGCLVAVMVAQAPDPKPLSDQDARKLQGLVIDLDDDHRTEEQAMSLYQTAVQQENKTKQELSKLLAELHKRYAADSTWDLNNKGDWVKLPEQKKEANKK